MLLADLSFCPLLELSNQGVWGMSKPRIAIVTGGGSGLGRALCFELSLEGHFVVVTDLDLESARQVVAELEEVNGQGEALELDVSSQEQVEHVVHDVVRRHGRLDYMFNNAGFVIAGDTIEMTSDQWRKIIAVNLEGVIWGTMAAYRIMAKQRFGHIVNTASCAGLSPLPLSTPYSMTKHAVVGLTRSMRPEADWHGVKLSVACRLHCYKTVRQWSGAGEDVVQNNHCPGATTRDFSRESRKIDDDRSATESCHHRFSFARQGNLLDSVFSALVRSNHGEKSRHRFSSETRAGRTGLCRQRHQPRPGRSAMKQQRQACSRGC